MGVKFPQHSNINVSVVQRGLTIHQHRHFQGSLEIYFKLFSKFVSEAETMSTPAPHVPAFVPKCQHR